MAIGIYKAIKRRKELGVTPYVFTNNLQIWLATFAFCSFIVSILWRPVWGWLNMLAELSGIELFAFILASLGGLLFGAMGIYSLIQLVNLFWRAKFGQIVRYDPETTPSNVLAAIEPIESSGKNIKQYMKALDKLIEQNNTLIATNNELISKYIDIVHKAGIKDKKE